MTHFSRTGFEESPAGRRRRGVGQNFTAGSQCADPEAPVDSISTMPVSSLIAGIILLASSAGSLESVCYGSAASGRLSRGVQLPLAGQNYSSYSALGWVLGRTYVHSKVAQVVVATFQALEMTAPGKIYVVGETGLAAGGRFSPHKTHQNGTSVDFMVPVMLAERSVPLPATSLNQFGYGLEFGNDGSWGSYRIDFEALGEHLYQLDRKARERGIGIARVILDVPLQKLLWKSSRGKYLGDNVVFSTRPAWVRHDEHYHVDFRVRCKATQD